MKITEKFYGIFKIKLLELIWKDFVTLEHDSDHDYHDSGDHFSDISFLTKIYRNLSQHFLSHKNI